MRAIVNAPICPLISQPRADCPLTDEALFGMSVEVLEETTPQYWKIRTPYRYEGFAPARCLISGDEGATAWAALPKRVILHKTFADVMTHPKVQSWPITTLPLGAIVAPVGKAENGWQPVALPDGREGYLRESLLGTYYESPIDLPEGALRQRLVDTALLYARTQYRWGGKTPLGIDCSGLVSMAYLLNGIVIYRDAHIREDFPIRSIDPKDIKPGDLLFFPGHVAMYMGDGRYLHSTGKAGSDGVTINSLYPDAPDFRPDLPEKLTAVGSYF